ncbi:MAG TPA: alpha/beta fold hydrolase [Candidatus Binatia bacterium]|nr:alpha/beta fold hydrolase [Candidatus Binatia bacterium]
MPYAENDGARIYWEEHGEGEPVLLIMGLGATLDLWYRLLPELSASHRAILLDNRGVGRSAVPDPPYSIPQMADDAAAVLDAAAVDTAHVIGASMGGVIAQELALRHPNRIRSLVLACTTCGGPDAVPAEPEIRDALVNRATMTPEEGIRALVPFTYHPDTPRSRVEEDLEIRLRRYPSTKGYLAQLQAVLGYETYGRLGAVRVPTLVLHGEDDQLVPAGNARDLARRIPGARLVLIPSASHILFSDQPEAVNRAILKFLQDVATR